MAGTLVEDLQRVVSEIHDHFDQNTTPLHFKLTDRRSLSANAQVHVWAKQISEKTGEDIKTVFARIKRDHGLPILLADPEHGKVANWMLKQFNYESLSDARQLIVIDAMEVTRKFSTKQHNALRDSVQTFYNSHGFNLQYMEKENGNE